MIFYKDKYFWFVIVVVNLIKIIFYSVKILVDNGLYKDNDLLFVSCKLN